MDRGTSLPDRSEVGRGGGGVYDWHTEGSNPGGNMGGGGGGKDWIGLSFEYSREKAEETQKQLADAKARNEAATEVAEHEQKKLHKL
jgi:hypothetical protein